MSSQKNIELLNKRVRKNRPKLQEVEGYDHIEARKDFKDLSTFDIFQANMKESFKDHMVETLGDMINEKMTEDNDQIEI